MNIFLFSEISLIYHNPIIMSDTYSLKNFYKFIEKAGLEVKPHQEQGVEWCLKRETKGIKLSNSIIRGGLIADEMGLGKTILVIGTIIANIKTRTLIVVPVVLLQQWNIIIQKMLGHVPILFHGPDRKSIGFERLSSAPIVLTTYGMINNRYSGGPLHQLKWNRVVYDEAHHIRNKSTSCYIGAEKLKTDIQWFVTGTPIQNSIKDFFTFCSLLKIPEDYYSDSDNLKMVVKLFVLKRTKQQVGIQLPELTQHKIIVPWKSEAERKIAISIHEQLGFSGLKTSEIPFNSSKYSIQRIMMARQICVMPSLLIPKIVRKLKAGEIHDSHRAMLAGLNSSSKLDAVIDLVSSRRENNRNKIIFCQFTQEIDEIQSRLTSVGIESAVYDGRTNSSERNAILTRTDLPVLILQIQTACEGVNLQQYSEIYFVAPHWNPAIEDQAVARCHRIGQENPVDVFRFYMQDLEHTNIEAHCLNIQQRKRLEFI